MQRSVSLKIDQKTEITRRISEKEAQAINEALQHLPNLQQTLTELRESINQTQWEYNPTINDPNMPYYALIALQEKIIPTETFFTLLQYWAITQYHHRVGIDGARVPISSQVKSHSLLINEAINPESFVLLLRTHTEESHLSKKPSFNLNQQEYAEFFEEIKKFPISEQSFFVVPYLKESKSVLKTLENLGFNVFGRIGTQKIVAFIWHDASVLKCQI